MGCNKIPESEYENIIEMYKNGMRQWQIAERYNVGRTAITFILHKFDIYRKDRQTEFDKYKDEMCDMYINGHCVDEIANIYGVNNESLRKKFNLWGVPMRHSIYTSNEHYFDEINDQNKAYILGLLWADGYNNVSRNTVLISLQEEDRYILDKINKLMENTHPLDFLNITKTNPKWKNAYRLAVTSEHMSKTLEDYGMVQAKSLVVEFPKILCNELYPHFIRGLLDGDGCIYKKQYGVSLVGTEMVLNKIQEWCNNILNIEAHIISQKGSNPITKELRIWNKKYVKIFLDSIYKDANLYLTRKYNIYISKYCIDENINNTLTA